MCNKTINRVDWILRAGIESAKTSQGRDRIEEMQIHSEYSEPGYSSRNDCIVTGNFNDITKYDRDNRGYVTLDDTPHRVTKLLEKAGADIEWSDEWDYCHRCNGLIRTEPDSYCWQRSYWQPSDWGERICINCVKEDPSEYIEDFVGSDTNCITIDIDLEEHGFKLAQKGFENGLHGGQAADPKLVAKQLSALGIERFLFVLDEVSQFYIGFSVWVDKDEYHLLDGELEATDGVDPAEMMKKALREASIPRGDGIHHTTIDLSNGTSITKTVSPEDFIEGNM